MKINGAIRKIFFHDLQKICKLLYLVLENKVASIARTYNGNNAPFSLQKAANNVNEITIKLSLRRCFSGVFCAAIRALA